MDSTTFVTVFPIGIVWNNGIVSRDKHIGRVHSVWIRNLVGTHRWKVAKSWLFRGDCWQTRRRTLTKQVVNNVWHVTRWCGVQLRRCWHWESGRAMGRAILNGSWTSVAGGSLFVGQLEISMKFAIVTDHRHRKESACQL